GGVHGVAPEVPQEVGVLLQHRDREPGPEQQEGQRHPRRPAAYHAHIRFDGPTPLLVSFNLCLSAAVPFLADPACRSPARARRCWPRPRLWAPTWSSSTWRTRWRRWRRSPLGTTP